MSEAGGDGATARLDELAKVTSEYAKYSRTSHGIALAVYGLALLVVAALDLVLNTFQVRFAYLVLPVVWLVALYASRGRYQRHGVVLVSDPVSLRAQRWIVGGLTVLSGLQVSTLVLRAAIEGRRGPDASFVATLTIAGAACLVTLIPVLSATVSSGRADLFMTLFFTVVPWGLVGTQPSPGPWNDVDTIFHRVMVAVAAIIAIASIVDGARQHARYRRLEERFRRIREHT